jgi:hypothetical protein
MTVTDQHPTRTSLVKSDEFGRSGEIPGARGGPTPTDPHGPRIRSATYEPAASAAAARDHDPTYEPGPITDDVPGDPVARAATQLIVRLIVEVLACRRSADHLESFVTTSVARCIRVAATRVADVRLFSLHLQQPNAEAVEATAVCRTASGHRALAVRIDRCGRRGWRCSSFRILL